MFESLCSPVNPNSRRAPHYFIHCLATKPCRSPNEWLSVKVAQLFQHSPLSQQNTPCAAAGCTLGLPLCSSVLAAAGAQKFNTAHCKVTTKAGKWIWGGRTSLQFSIDS